MCNHNRKIIVLLLCLCAGVFAISAGKIAAYILQSQQAEREFAELAQSIELTRQTPDIADETAQILAGYQELHAQNPDFWGWIKIEDTELNYPIMYTPTDPEYYLRRDFEGNYSQLGVPFLDADCTEDCGNYIIYGHNMKNGKMFAPLLAYAEEDFYRAHPTIQLDTPKERGSYQIVAAFYAKAYYQEDTNVFKYYQYTDLSDQTRFDEFASQVKNAAIYDTGNNPSFGDQLLTLSTCDYSTENGRFVVVARKN